MRVLVLAVLVACTPPAVVKMAGDRLGVHGKHLHLVDADRLGDRDVYTFCRNERPRDVGNLLPFGARSYDGACITLVCAGVRCD